MTLNDIYNDRSGITTTSVRMTTNQARDFMKEVAKHPTHTTKVWIVKDIKTGSRIYL